MPMLCFSLKWVIMWADFSFIPCQVRRFSMLFLGLRTFRGNIESKSCYVSPLYNDMPTLLPLSPYVTYGEKNAACNFVRNTFVH